MSDPARPSNLLATPANRSVSAIFIVLLLVLAGAALELGLGRGGAGGVFAFVFVGWIISLCLHEWGHAATAWAGGDRGVEELGYLTLNPLRYANPFMSIVIPLAFLAMGGIGFPGGAVYVNKRALRGPAWRAAVSAAGPAMNLAFLAALALVIHVGGASGALLAALAFLGFLQATAFILNLLPIPGLDGFGIIESLFPEGERPAMAQIGRFASLAFFVVILSAPQVLQPVWQAAEGLCNLLGIDTGDIADGVHLFRFWDSQP
jgi:Zn-dependent protease